jgi:hypothetical protein
VGAKYYTLAVSLPHMPDLEKAQRLPITEPRLKQRLKVLGEADMAQLDAVGDVLRMHAEPVRLTDSQAAQTYRQADSRVNHPVLKDLLEFRMDQLTVLAAMRMRRRGQGPPQGTAWGMGTRMRWIARHWDQPEFALGHVFPWLAQVRQLLESGKAAALQTLLWRQLWDRLTAYQNAEPFGLGDVFGSVLKWHILRLWLGQDATASARRFEELSVEVTRDKLRFV